MKRQKLVNLLFEEDMKFNDIYGDAQSTKYGESPAEKVASQSEPGAGNEFLKLGDEAKDKVKAGGEFGPIAASKLKASQAEVLFPKAIKMAAGFLKGESGFKPEGNIGGIITKDKQILDGHHRWAGSYIVNPESQLSGTEVDMGWKEAIPVLRAIGIAFGHETGNAANDSKSVWGSAGDLSLEDFTKIFVDAVINLNGGWEKQKGVPTYVGSEFSDYDSTNKEHQKKLVLKLYENYMKLKKEGAPPSGMPSRIDMPVLVSGGGEDKFDDEGNITSQANKLGADEVKAATHLLSKGAIDVKPNYNDKLKKVAANESIDLQRWNKLAGLIKG